MGLLGMLVVVIPPRVDVKVRRVVEFVHGVANSVAGVGESTDPHPRSTENSMMFNPVVTTICATRKVVSAKRSHRFTGGIRATFFPLAL